MGLRVGFRYRETRSHGDSLWEIDDEIIAAEDVPIDLFQELRDRNRQQAMPLAARMRPRQIEEFVGQEHFFGPGKLLRRMLEADRLSSVIFYGPPGTGKTALARVISEHAKGWFQPLNAVNAGTKEVREILAAARNRLEQSGGRTIFFLDEIHRFNRAQQDVLLPDVEEGVIILIGATTENPFFSINGPLLSRSQIFTFEPLQPVHLHKILDLALADTERGLGTQAINITDEARQFLIEMADGDARRLLGALEIAVKSSADTPIRITLEVAQDSIQRKIHQFDPTGDTHYDLASAFIKSMRGSDVDAALYWLARMIESGEDPRFIARRIVIFASEDVGNADPRGLMLATATLQAVQFVGLPECALNLAQAVTYLALAPKSNASTLAIGQALKDVRQGMTLQVPKHLRDSHYAGAKTFGHGKDYQYSHDYPDAVTDQAFLPEGKTYYTPTDRGFEAELQKRLEWLQQRRKPQPQG